METKKAIVLLSGGLDSTVALADTLTRMDVACVLTFDYGQRAFPRELAAAQAITAHYGLRHQVIDLPWLADLLPQAMRPDAQQAAPLNLSREEWFEVTQVWVPNRNGVFLNIAAAFAEAVQAQTVVFGANAEEGAAFPDNTIEFREALNVSLSFSTLNGVRVETPVGQLSKQQIIEHGLALNVPLERIWSCYNASSIQCGECASCLRVKEAQSLVGKTSAIAFAG